MPDVTQRDIQKLQDSIHDLRDRFGLMLSRSGGYVSGQIDLSGWLQLDERSAPSQPATDKGRLYAKTDGLLYWQDDTGTEHDLTSGGGGGGAPESADYLVLTLDATLTGERRFVPGTGLSAVDGGAGGDYTLNVDATELSHDDLLDVSEDDHHNRLHALDSASDHSANGLTTGHVLRATGATTFAWGSIQAGDLPRHTHSHDADLTDVSANDHHNQQHVLAGSDHTASGLTTGHVLRATGASAFAWQQLQHDDLGGVGEDDHHNRQHGMVDADDHTVSGSTLDLVGLDGTDSLAVLTPSADVSGGETAILRSQAGKLTLADLATGQVSSHLIPATTDTYDLGSYTRLWSQSFISQINAVVFTEATAALVGGWLIVPKGQGTFAADVASGATQIDFGQAMTNGHFVLVRAHDTGGTIKAEYMQVGSLVSGTTYNVTRDLAGAHGTDPAWAEGTAYLILGTSGDGRIELNAYDTPRISIIEQGGSYNAQSERVRIGDLDGWGAYSSEQYGIAMGNWTGNEYLTYDPSNGLRVRGSVYADDGHLGSLTVQGTLDVSTSGVIKSGASAYNSGTGYWLEYNGGTPRVFIGNSGGNKLTWNGSSLAITGAITATSGTLQSLSVTGTLTLSGSGKLITGGSYPRIELNTSYLAGYSDASTRQFYISAATGKAYAGGDLVGLDSDGLTIVAGAAAANKIQWRRTNLTGYVVGEIVNDGGNNIQMSMTAEPPSSSSYYSAIDIKAWSADLSNHGEILLRSSYGANKAYVMISAGSAGHGGLVSVNDNLEVSNRLYVNERIYIYRSGTQMGDFATADTTWFRINQNTAKNIYTPRMLRSDGGIVSGSTTCGYGQIAATGSIYCGNFYPTGIIGSSTPVACHVVRTSDMSVNSGSWTFVTFSSAVYDSDSMWSAGQAGRVTAKRAGFYIIGGTVNWAASSGGNFRSVAIRVKGSTWVAYQHSSDMNGGTSVAQSAVTGYYLSAGDYAQIAVYQDSGGSLSLDYISSSYPVINMWMVRVA